MAKTSSEILSARRKEKRPEQPTSPERPLERPAPALPSVRESKVQKRELDLLTARERFITNKAYAERENVECRKEVERLKRKLKDLEAQHKATERQKEAAKAEITQVRSKAAKDAFQEEENFLCCPVCFEVM